MGAKPRDEDFDNIADISNGEMNEHIKAITRAREGDMNQHIEIIDEWLKENTRRQLLGRL